jgi:hypothetical protein
LPEQRVSTSVADPDPGSGALSTPGSEIRDKQPGSYFQEPKKQFFGLKYINSLIWIRNPGWKKFGSGMKKVGSGIRDKYPGYSNWF